jgi:bilirubin oxidase
MMPKFKIKTRLLLGTTLFSILMAIVLSVVQNDMALKRAVANDRPFQNLWIPPLLEGKNINLTLSQTSKSFWPGATTQTYGFNQAEFWGPTLVLNRDETVNIHVKNALNEPTTVHWHGLHLPATMDGGPHQEIPAGGTWDPSFQVKNNAATYWYHPHAHGTTQKQITMGAGGLIIVKDPQEAKLPLPRTYGVDDLPVVLTSRRFYANQEFSQEGDDDKYGDFLLTNGTLDAQVSLPAQFVRLRVLNAEIERGYQLGFSDNRTFYVIANDGGLLEKPVAVSKMRLMVGERVELLVNLSNDQPGSTLDLMAYNGRQPFGFPGGEPGNDPPNGSYLNNRTFRLLHINVKEPKENRITKLPVTLIENKYWTAEDVQNRRTLNITADGPGRPFSFNEELFDMHKTNQVVKLGDVEQWTVANNRIFGHSFHIHDVQFKIVSRSGGPVEDYEKGWKDTVYVPRNQSVTFITRFEDYASDNDPFMYHCHMSNHEDGGMMGSFLVVDDPTRLKKDANGRVSFRPRREHPLTPAMIQAAADQAKKPAPIFQSKDINGNLLNFKDLTATKPLVLYFIEKECPCSAEAAPFMDRIQDEFGPTCQVVGVMNANQTEAKAWAQKVGTRFPIIADPDLTIIRAYGAEQSVYTTLVAPGGSIVKTFPGYGQAMLQELSAQLARHGGVAREKLAIADAPSQLVSGCPFPQP